MKAGIYKLFDGTLVYVKKDRSIAATRGQTTGLSGKKVTTLDKEQEILIDTDDKKQLSGKRVGDVPNGCINHVQALHDFENAQAKEAPTLEVDTTLSPAPLADGVPAKMYQDGGFVGLHGEEVPTTLPNEIALMPYQRESIEKAMQTPPVFTLPSSAAKTERFIGKHPALGMGYRISANALLGQSANAAETVQQIHDNLRSQGYVPVDGTDEWVLDDDFVRLNKAMKARGFVFRNGQFEGDHEAATILSEDLYNGRATDLDGLGGFTYGLPARSLPYRPDDMAMLRQRHEEAREATLRLSTNTYGSPPVQPPPMSAFDVGYSDPATCLAALKAGKFRLCHAASARKHRKKKDRHVWWHPVFGCYAWRMTA